MKGCTGRQHNVWIFVCIFGCMTSDIKTVLCNQYVENVQLIGTGDVCGEPNSEVHNDGQNVIDNPDHNNVQDRELTADTKVNCDGNDDIAQIAYTGVTKPCNCKEHTQNSTNINIEDVITNSQYNYNGNIADIKSNLDDTHTTTIYLAGYDDQIFKLINDIQKHSPANELLIYFYLFTKNSYRNICYLYTDKNTLRDCISKYTHYFCVGHNRNDCICFKNLGHVQKPTLQTGQELYIKPELNKIDDRGSIPGKYINTEPATVKLADIGGAISDSKTYYPEKGSLEAYEFILPKEKDIKFKDIYIDVLRSQKPKALTKNQIIQVTDSIQNAKSKIENKNRVSNKDIAASIKPIFSELGAYDFKGIPNGAIQADSNMKNPDDTNILTDLNIGKGLINNNGIYANGITDKETNQGNTLIDNTPHVNLPDIGNVLQFKPNINKEPGDITLLNKSNMQVDGNKLEVQIIPSTEIIKPENTIAKKPTTSTSNIENEIVSETSSPKIVSYTYSQNSPENNNALNENIAKQVMSSVGNDKDGTVSLTPTPIPGTEMNPNLKYSNVINDAENTKLDNENIILNPALSNEKQVNEMTPRINEIEMAANKEDLNTNEVDGRNDKNNTMAIDDKTHIHNTDNTPTVKIQDRSNNVDFVNTNYQSIPNSDMNINVKPQSYVHDYNDDHPINTQPCNNINDQLIHHKQHLHFHPWNNLQYGDFQKLNQPILQNSDQTNKVGLFGLNPFNNMLHSIPGGVHMHYDFPGNEKYYTSSGKLSYIQNANTYSLGSIKGMPALNLLRPLQSYYKNPVSNPEKVANMIPEKYITNNVWQQDNPFNIPQKLIASENIPLNSLRLNGLPTNSQSSLTNYNPLLVGDRYGTSIASLPLQSDSKLSQTGFPQPLRMSNSQGINRYITVAPKVQPTAQDVTATGLLNNANFITTRLSTAFPNSVSPTLNSCYYKTSLTKPILSTPTDATYYPSTSINTYNPFSYVPVAPVKDKIESPYANLSPSLFLPKSIADSSKNIVIPYQSSSKLSEQRSYASNNIYVPKSKFISYLSPKAKFCSSISPALSLSDLEPIVSNPFKIKNIVTASSVLPLSTLMQDKHTHTPLVSNTESYKPFSVVEASLPSKKSETLPNLLELDKLTSEPTPGNNDSINPTKLLEPPSNYKVLPNNIMSFTPLNQPLSVPYNNAILQNIISYVNAVPSNTISPIPDLSLLTPTSNTLDIESPIDMKKSPYTPHSFPVDAKLYSTTKAQNSISFVPNFVTTKPYQSNLSPISFNGGKYSTFINTQKSTQQNLLTSKPNTLRAQPFEKYLISNEKLESNMSPDIFGPTNTETHPTKDSKPLVLSPNYLVAPKYTDGNINPCLLSNYQKSVQPKICPSIAKPFEWLMSGNGDSMGFKNSKSLIPYSYHSIATETLMPTLMDSILPTQDSLTDTDSGPVQPCRFVENFATPVPSNIISTYSYIPGKKQNKITWIPPCTQNGDPYLQVNNLNNNFASVYQIPRGKLVFKEVPLKYGEDYGLIIGPVTSIEVPKYGLPSQVTYTESTPLLQTGNVDLNARPKLELQSTIEAISKLGLQTPKMWSMSKFPDSTRPFESNNEWTGLDGMDSFFLEQKTPKLAPNKMFNLNPSTYPQREGSFIPSRSNEVTYPSSMLNLVLPVPGSVTSNMFTSSQDNTFMANKVTKISLTQGISPNILPFHLDTASKPSAVASIHNDIFSLRPLNSHFHVSAPWNSSPNNLNTLWPSFIAHNKDFNSKDEVLSNLIATDLQNLTLLSAYQNPVTTPGFGTAISISNAVNTPKMISPTALNIDTSVPQLASWPILNKQHLTPCNNLIQKPLDFSSFVNQIKPTSKIDDNKASSNLQPLTLGTSNLFPKAIDTITWSNLFPSSYPQGTQSNSISSPYESPSPPSSPSSSSSSSSPINFPFSPSLSYSSKEPTLTTLSSKGYLPYSPLLWKTLSLNQKPDLTSHFTDTDSTQRFYASSNPQSITPNFESETPSNLQLNPNYNPNLSISTYFPNPYSKIKETDLNFYQNLVSNTLGYYKYGDLYKNEQMIPKLVDLNLSQIVHTNRPYYSETSNFENLEQSNNNAMNQIKYDLNNYMKQRDVLSNCVLSGNLINIPLHNVGIVQYEPNLCKVSYMKTNNPDIYLKIWPAAVRIVKAKIVFEIDKLNALNFCPVVQVPNSQYTNEEILNVVENFVKTFYGEPIIVKTMDSKKSYAVVDNIDESCIKNGKVYILWANVRDCGCNRIGCHCSS